MGAGTSTEAVADKPNEEQVEQCIDLGQQEQGGQEEEVNTAGGAKMLHTNGKIAIINGAADEGMEAIQASAVNGCGMEEEIAAAVKEVEQQEPASVTLEEEHIENMGVVQNDTNTKETLKEDGQVQTPEATDRTPESEEKAEPSDQANENQSNEVGFKKVFKFVGFKFTVRKDKTEKSEPVQLLTVKKEEVEVNGIDNHEEHTDTTDDRGAEIQQETKDDELPAESPDKPAEAAEAHVETPEENQKKVEEAEVEKDQKSPASPTNPVIETSSPFRRFFTQGWAGLRKKTSFKKSKEEDPQEVEKHIKIEEQEKAEAPEAVKEECTTEKQPSADHSVPQELSKSSSEDSKVSAEENNPTVTEEKPKQDNEPDNEAKVKLLEVVKLDEEVAPVAENTECAPKMVTPVPETTSLPEVTAEAHTLEDNVETQMTDGIIAVSSPGTEGISENLQGTSESGAVDNDQPQLASSTECGETEMSLEAITTEVELLSSQEKAKVQGSPLKKLFSSSGLRKLSGKKSKSKKDDDGKVEVTTEAVPSESPEAPETDGGDSSPSSPDESAETSPTDKPLEDVQQTAEAEGEGTSDGERKKEGITPWASFKKLVTPKRRPKRPSESDKEDEVEKAKTSTMSSTDSAGTVENQEEPKEINDEQKLEKSTDESKKKVDSSVSWEALICVGSSKKRARKTSDSDEDEGIKSQDEAKKTEEVLPTKETDSDSPITSSQEQQILESASPDQADSPTEADGVSTWQSFKRLVTPRRKSRTRVEEKTDETTTVANAEQSTSEGETGKEETWVSFKKLIPGRKKKKSDGKQEHALETGQTFNETAEDDSDEPAVVPLSEFDAAEREKLDAQKSLKEALPTVLGGLDESLDKSTEELLHAVTVTVIEGERAITSLEERSPSWISAKVSEISDHAKETEEATERIKTEITVEEAMVLSTVSQVMAEMPNTINEMELTSEALTALEEAIENSCAEETTEMRSAISQLGESIVSTEEATPVPEEDARLKTLEDQKKHTENMLHKAAEKAKLTIDTLQLQISQNVTNLSSSDTQVSVEAKEMVCVSAPLCVEEQTNLTPDSLEDQGYKSTIVSAEETVEQVFISVIEKTNYSATTSKILQDDVNAPVVTVDQTSNICASAPFLKEQVDRSTTLLSTEKNDDGDLSTSSGDQVVKQAPTSNEAKDVTLLKTKKKCEDVSDSATEPVVQESTTALYALCAKKDSFSAEDVKTNKDITCPTEMKESVLDSKVQPEEAVPASGAFQIADNLLASNELQTKECAFVLAEDVLLSSKPQFKVLPVSCELHPEGVAPVSTEVHPEVIVPVLIEAQPEEVAPLSSDVHPEEVVPVSSGVQPEVVPVSTDVQPEVLPVFCDVPEEVVTVSSDMQPAEVVPVSTEVQFEVVSVSCDVQPEEVVPVLSDVHLEVVTVSTEVQPEVVPVSSDMQPEVVPLSSDVQPEVVPLSIDVQPEDVPVLSDVQLEVVTVSTEAQSEVVPVSSGMQPEEVVPVARDVQLESEVQSEAVVSVSSDVQPEVVPVSTEIQFEVVPVSNDILPEVVPVSSDVQLEVIPVSTEVQSEVVPVSSDKQLEEFVLLPTEIQPEEAVPVSSDAHPEEVVPVSSDAQPEEVVLGSSDVDTIEALITSSDLQPEEIESVSNAVKPEECISLSNEFQAEGGLSASNEPQFEVDSVSNKVKDEVVPFSEVQKSEEVIPVCTDIEDKSGVLASNQTLAAEKVTVEGLPVSIGQQDKECAPVSVEVQYKECLNVSVKEQAEGNVSISDDMQAEEGIAVMVGESVPLSDEVQVEVDASVLAEVKTEETTLVLAEVHTEKLAPMLAMQVEEQAHESAKVQTIESALVSNEVQAEDNIQAGQGANFPVDVQAEEISRSDELKTEEISSALAEVQAEEDHSSVSSNVQAEEVTHRTCEVQAGESFLLSCEVQAKERSGQIEVQVQEIVQESKEAQSTDFTPVLGKEVEQVDKCVSVLDDTQTEMCRHVAIEVHTEQMAPVTVEQMNALQSEVSDVQAEEATVSVEIQDGGKASAAVNEEHIEVPTVTDTEENVPQVLNNTQENETFLGATQYKESYSDNQTSKLTTEEDMAENVAEQETSTLPSETVHIISNNTEFKDTPASTAQEKAKESEVECKEDKITLNQEEIVEKDIVTADIPALEGSEAVKASEPLTTATVEVQVLAETVKTIEITTDSIETSEVADDTRSEDNEVLSKGLQVVVESVSQKAAAIVDAAIEAATNCFVVDATSQSETVEETTVTEETNVQTIRIESHSITIVQNIIETAVEAVASSIHMNETVSVQGQNLESGLDSQVQKTVPVHLSIKSCPQHDETEPEMTVEVKNTGKEIESAVPDHTRGENEHQVSTQASDVNAQEQATTVES